MPMYRRDTVRSHLCLIIPRSLSLIKRPTAEVLVEFPCSWVELPNGLDDFTDLDSRSSGRMQSIYWVSGALAT
jgi:hypothetical protein